MNAMNRMLLSLVLLAGLASKAVAYRSDYLSGDMLWYLSESVRSDDAGEIFFEGDTVVEGRACRVLRHRILKNNRMPSGRTYTYGCFYQEGQRIYKHNSEGGFSLYYDFGAEPGDTIKWGTEPCDTLVVTAVDSVCLRDGKKHRRLTFLNITKSHHYYIIYQEEHYGYVGQWIEGIGSSMGFITYPYKAVWPSYTMLDCRRGDDVVCDSWLFSGEAERYNCRMLSYNPVWTFRAPGGKDGSSPARETVTRKEARLYGFYHDLQPYVFLNISTPEADGTYSDHEVALLEEDGRVYVCDSGFDQYMQDVHPEITEPFIERKYFFLFLLYDFTLDVGDRYPCRGEVYVERTGTLATRDGVCRRTLTLTNGLVIVEGIGCVNSPLGLIAYQSTEAGQASKDSSVLTSFGYVGQDGNVSTVYENGDIDLDCLPRRSFAPDLSDTVYDLQGRRINGIPQKGVYIQNGRKYVR